ncbi:hypothetical protein DRO32_02660, partial [Candidatus Bathyarchaeota archaeon]
VGDIIRIGPLGPGEEPPRWAVKVVGVAKAFPGVRAQAGTEEFVVLRLDLAGEMGLLGTSTPYFLVKVAEGADPAQVAEAIELAYPDKVSEALTVQEEMEGSLLALMGMPVSAFLKLCFGFSLTTATLGLALTAAVSSRERLYEINLMRARGLRRRQALLVLAVEALVVALIGALVGLFTGVVTARGLMGMFKPVWPLEVRLVVPPDFWALLAASFLAFLLASLIPPLLAFRRTVVETIRFR